MGAHRVVGGNSPSQNMWLISIPLAGLAIGVTLALYFKYGRRQDIYRNLGREARVVDLAVED